ncbi:DUF3304 domain-containing protein [Xanthomonas translucens]|uniref:DUF3304 domain-containing protein n=3 Tax=Xanthomonas campestris pv. translucens TaxID=343 RepID=UPI002714C4CA|nr:DUF3304 domain-containing protein [Xanthomonas translucens]WLA10455.1 DUF3304 domain-containing protein [Xanthomonas translucens]
MRHHDDDQTRSRSRRAVARLLVALMLLSLLAACKAEPSKTAEASISAYNHTEDYIHQFYINGQWGGNSYPYGGGGKFTCCITYPRQWRPGLTAKVRWTTSSGIPGGDDGTPTWHEKVVPIERYEKPGTRLNVHFLPEGKVRLLIWNGAAGSKGYKGPDAPVKPDNWPPLPPPPILPDAKSEHTDAEQQP